MRPIAVALVLVVKKEQLLERAVALAQRFAPARTMLASLKMDLGRPAEALALARTDGERKLAQTTLDNYLKALAR